MRTLVIHNADMESVGTYSSWLKNLPDTSQLHELSMFYKNEADDIRYLAKQIMKAIAYYKVEKLIFFSFFEVLGQDVREKFAIDFPNLIIEQYNQ